MGLLYDGVEDEAEILFQVSHQSIQRAEKKIKSKKALLVPVGKHIISRRKLAAIPSGQLLSVSELIQQQKKSEDVNR